MGKTLNPEKITKEKIMAVIPGSKGIYANIARALDCQYETIYLKMKKYPELKPLIEAERERIDDLVEDKFIQLVNEGNTQCILHYMKSILKKRGYGEKIETDVNVKQMPKLEIKLNH